MSDCAQQTKIARVLPRLHWGATPLLVCAMILWFIAPAAPAYLLVFASVGVLWSVTVVWMWRMWSVIGTLAAMFVFAIGYLLPLRLFSVSSQVGELQGLFLAFSIAAFLLWVFRTRVIRYARLAERTEEPFIDQSLGQFTFERDLGWKKEVMLENRQVELVLGSDGEPPCGEMLQTAKSWLEQWPSQRPKIIEYIRRELQAWSDEPNLPVPEDLEVESINILWADKPSTSMIYFHHPGDDIRVWHVTFEGFEPQGFAYDD